MVAEHSGQNRRHVHGCWVFMLPNNTHISPNCNLITQSIEEWLRSTNYGDMLLTQQMFTM